MKLYKQIRTGMAALSIALIGGCLAACNNDDEPDGPTIDPVVPGKPTWSVSPESDCAKAPAWTAIYPEGADAAPDWQLPDLSVFPTSMSAVISLPTSLQQYASADDRLGAFIGGECRGLATLNSAQGSQLWFVVIKAADGETRAVEFRYYSALLKRVYTADDGVKYATNSSYGNVTAPATPSFESGMRLTGNVVIPTELVGYSTAYDRLALMVGDECRAVGTLVNNGTYAVDGFVQPGESFSFSYYNSRLGYLFGSNADVMTAGRQIGSAGDPYRLDFGLQRCHPLRITFTVALPEELQGSASAEDVVGVFVGDECRGVAAYGAPTSVEVRASLSAESYVIRYFCVSTGTYYRSREALPMPNENAGTADNPLVPELTKD